MRIEIHTTMDERKVMVRVVETFSRTKLGLIQGRVIVRLRALVRRARPFSGDKEYLHLFLDRTKAHPEAGNQFLMMNLFLLNTTFTQLSASLKYFLLFLVFALRIVAFAFTASIISRSESFLTFTRIKRTEHLARQHYRYGQTKKQEPQERPKWRRQIPK